MVHYPDGRKRKSYRPVPPEVLQALARHEAEEKARLAAFGDVRPIIATEFQGHQLVGVDNTLHWSPTWRTFTDFLLSFIVKTLTPAWGTTELTKPLESRHTIMQWFEAFLEFKKRHQAGPDGLAKGEPDGPALAYLLLAYDLYILRDHRALLERNVGRLRNPGQFQGARYELTVTATMIRAGFDLTMEDEGDKSTKHVELTATHRATGQRLAVEAKSRHYPGVLGRGGVPKDEAAFRLNISRSFRAALKKPRADPFAIFIDANMPPQFATGKQQEWMEDVNHTIRKLDHGFNEVGIKTGSLFNYLAVTNVPHHYGAAGAAAPVPLVYQLIPSHAQQPMKHPEVLSDIEWALGQMTNIPQELPLSQSNVV